MMLKFKNITKLGTIALISLALVACASGPRRIVQTRRDGPPQYIPHNLMRIPDAVPRAEPLSKCGNRFKGGNCYVAKRKRYRVLPTSKGYRARGQASWYGTQFHGRKTSSGEHYDMFAMTAAHPTLPLPTYARVTNLKNGKSVIVKINDRGPFHSNRIIDLSYVAAAKLGVLGAGTAHVEVESVDPRDHHGHPKRRAPLQLAPKQHIQIASNTKIAPNNISKHQSQNVKNKIKPLAPITPVKRKIYLQMGPFNKRAKAENIIKELGKLSKSPAFIASNVKTSASTEEQYRVKIGPFANDEDAIMLSQKLAQSKLPQPVVINE